MTHRRRILIIRPSALGDVCRSVHLAASIRAAWPDARIEWLVNAPYADAVRWHPCVDEAIPFHRGSRTQSLTAGNTASFIALARDLRARRYDIVIDAQGLARSGALSVLSSAPIRIARRDAREGAGLVANRRVGTRHDSSTHTVDAMAELLTPLSVEPVLDLRLTAPPTLDPAVPVFDAEPIVMAPTSLWPGKRWPIERFAEAASRLSSRAPIAVVGGPNEREQCAAVLALPGVIDLVGKTSVGGLMQTVERASLVIANDSAALHMAVGFDRPIVALFGPTRTERVGPYRRAADVIQHTGSGDMLDHKNAAAGRALMERISVEEVIDAATERLDTR